MSLEERLVTFDACFNFRDLGGYRTADGRHVRWGRLYRSDTLHRLTTADVVAFGSLGIRTVIDLRTDTELEDHGSLSHHGRKRLSWHHVPIFDGVMRLQPKSPDELAALEAESTTAPENPGQTYIQMLGDGSRVAQVFDLLSDPEALPGVFHCTSGKDRTGMIAAMTLDLLGVEDAFIAADYTLTNETRGRSTAWISANEPVFAAFLAQIPPERRRTQPETILGFLEAIRSNFGSVDKLLGHHGVSADRLDAFRANLLDE